MTHRFVIYGRLPALNDLIDENRSSKLYAASQKKRWTGKVAWMIKAQGLPLVTKPFVLRMIWYERDKRRDPDNIAGGGQKILCDSLQQAGVIHNDGWSQVKAISHRFRIDKKAPRVEVSLREVR